MDRGISTQVSIHTQVVLCPKVSYLYQSPYVKQAPTVIFRSCCQNKARAGFNRSGSWLIETLQNDSGVRRVAGQPRRITVAHSANVQYFTLGRLYGYQDSF